MAAIDSIENFAIKNDIEDKDNIIIKQDTADLTLLQNGEIYSTLGECIFEGQFNVTIPEDFQGLPELIDFEQLIDSTLNFNGSEENTDFETGLDTFIVSRDKDRGIHNLDEISYYFEQIFEEGHDKNIQKVDIADNSEINVDLDTESNDVPTYKDISAETKNDQQEIIIISDDDDALSGSSDGYHSSDFEFISEEEAKIVGLLNNLNKIKCPNTSVDEKLIKTELETNESHGVRFENSIANEGTDSKCENVVSLSRHLSDPGEGPSGFNESTHDYSDNEQPQNHIMPEGDEYVELFQGPFNPVLPMADIILLENKSIRPSPMNIQYEGLGFDKQLAMQGCDTDSSDDEFADEAKESIKKIMSMYPDYNRQPRRRRF